MNYYPSPCELSEVANLTIAACHPLDGKTDGVVARSDLCKLHFNINSTIGKPYSCPATEAVTASSTPAQPAQNGTISVQGVKVAAKILDGLKDSQGRRVYFSYQPATTFVDAQTQYNSNLGQWTL